MRIPIASNELNEAAGRSPGRFQEKRGGKGGRGCVPAQWFRLQRGWERAMEWVSGTAEMPRSGHPEQKPPTAGPSGDRPGLGALPLLLEASRQAGGSFSSSPAPVTAKANRVPATPNGR